MHWLRLGDFLKTHIATTESRSVALLRTIDMAGSAALSSAGVQRARAGARAGAPDTRLEICWGFRLVPNLLFPTAGHAVSVCTLAKLKTLSSHSNWLSFHALEIAAEKEAPASWRSPDSVTLFHTYGAAHPLLPIPCPAQWVFELFNLFTTSRTSDDVEVHEFSVLLRKDRQVKTRKR